jgi:hypothetical protein
MGVFSRMMQNAADRVAFGLGSQTAAGRLNLSAATAEVRKQWGAYAGRKAIRAPTIRHVSNFLAFQFGGSWDEELVSRVTGADPGETLDMNDVLPRLADMLLDSGVIVVERQA